MKKYLSRTLVMLLVIAMSATQLLLPAFATTEAYDCICDAATREGVCIGSYQPTCGDFGYDLYVCDACGGNYAILTAEPTGNHDIVSVDAQEATCEEIGWDAYEYCTGCKYTTYAEIPATGHTEADAVTENDVPAGCVDAGSYDSVVYCEVCGKELSRETINVDPEGHVEADAVKENEVSGDCETPASYDSVIYCEVCGEELSRETIVEDAPGHDFVEIDRVEADCVNNGVIYYECSVCGETKEETIVCPGEHDYVVIDVIEATCTECAIEIHECTRCGFIINNPVGEPNGHTPGAEATCTEAQYCEVCDKLLVDALGHDYVASETVAPNCSNEGYTVYTCTRCGDSYIGDIVPIDPLSHPAIVTKPAVAPTCTQTGLTAELVCEFCGLVLAEQKEVPVDPEAHTPGADATCTENQVCEECDAILVQAHGHTYDNGGVTEPTCTEEGYTTYTCICTDCECGYSYTDNIVRPLGHDANKADCYTDSVCSRCGEILEEKFDHSTWETIGYVEATCTTGAYTILECTICGDIGTIEDEEAPAFGHTESDVQYENVIDATCTEDGSHDEVIYCVTCGIELVRNEMIDPALGHAPMDMVIENIIDATCTEDGSHEEVVYCERCGELTRDLVVDPAMGHVPGEGPTCTEAQLCQVCGEVLEEALGHDYVVVPGIEPTYDSTGLTEGKYCSVCFTADIQEIIPMLSEQIEFTYVAEGINGVESAVNSGYITVKVYMNVLSDIARIWGIDNSLNFNDALELISVDGCIFEQTRYTPVDIANIDNNVKITQDMGFSEAKTFEKGEYLFATLVFRVDNDFYYEDPSFDVVVDDSVIARDFANELIVDFGTGVEIHIDMLGDANGDGVLNAIDSMELSKWFAEADEDDYATIFDMNKDGVIDGEDFALLRGAIVRDYTYLEI